MQYEKMHEERMAMLKEKHPEHYARMEARRQEVRHTFAYCDIYIYIYILCLYVRVYDQGETI
jgi:hypothetical protein